MTKTVAIIGGGAAGFFGALCCKESCFETQVTILERSNQLLSKVRISGGGRCNVTHNCFDPRSLIQAYPRGAQQLLGPFHQFQPKDTIAWFAKRGVALYAEEDGRMFPASNCSQTIIDCFMREAKRLGVAIQMKQTVRSLLKVGKQWRIVLASGDQITADAVLIATGSALPGHRIAKQLGHTIIDPVASLFTFNVPTSPLLDLAGICVEEVCVSLAEKRFKQEGPILLTHWGFSGPAILKLSAWAARFLHACSYRADFYVNWLPKFSAEQVVQTLRETKNQKSAQLIKNAPAAALPRKLWQRLAFLSGIQEEKRWSHLSKEELQALAGRLHSDRYQLTGKTTYKEEFVTCGGVLLDEVHMQTMQSRLHETLFFAGEVLNIDAITGGFNFQAAWTTGYLAAKNL